jgi:hypothetical protein
LTWRGLVTYYVLFFIPNGQKIHAARSYVEAVFMKLRAPQALRDKPEVNPHKLTKHANRYLEIRGLLIRAMVTCSLM